MFAVVQHRTSRVIIYTAKPSCRMPRVILPRAVSSNTRSVKATVINSKLRLFHRNLFTQRSRGEGGTSTVTRSATRAFPLRHPGSTNIQLNFHPMPSPPRREPSYTPPSPFLSPAGARLGRRVRSNWLGGGMVNGQQLIPPTSLLDDRLSACEFESQLEHQEM
ncbi:hypothetical protein BDP55DRAFT_276457 [Colletotrichum godetiae]|uniref:Uncharacterized protein n=1 Tax=Colletotrichum godetiae TaxID=1209918 RepID=A0AAJ0EU99_9PEZI|nr:uncharacterized protein BDP55DRAFT_276457 [Colletotrichum godetiae]KAK1672024.1 hypothetical protein BDP55DRAFT_276457 [Colletotrichum godetiae]